MNVLANTLVDRIHTTPTKVVLFVTGGGLGVFETLTHRGGGSATLLSGLIPYDTQETIELLGHQPEKLVSEEATRAMAMVAFERALKLSKGEYPVIGVAVSSVLQKTPYERAGRKHFVYAVLQTDTKTVSCVLNLGEGVAEPNLLDFDKYPTVSSRNVAKESGVTTRMSEEAITASLILNLIAEGCGVEERVSLGYNLEDDLTRRESTLQGISVSRLLNGPAVPFDCHDNDGPIGDIVALPNLSWMTEKTQEWHGRMIFPGSFNPYHKGHEEMCWLAMDMGRGDIEFEISIGNVDKPVLDLLTLEERLQNFCHGGNAHGPTRVWVSNAPTFAEKCEEYPGALFICGYDTAKRICDPKYGDLRTAFQTMRDHDVRFLVFGREVNGVYNSGLDEFPDEFRALATACNHPRKYAAISSTEIRRNTQKG